MFVLDRFLLQTFLFAIGCVGCLSKGQQAYYGQDRQCYMTVIVRTFGRVCSLRLVNLQISRWTADS